MIAYTPCTRGEGAELITRLLCAKELLPRKGGGRKRELRIANATGSAAFMRSRRLDMNVQQCIRRDAVFVLREVSYELIVGDRCQQERHV